MDSEWRQARATYNMRRNSARRATCITQHAPCKRKCNVKHAPCNMQPTSCNMQPALTMRHAARCGHCARWAAAAAAVRGRGVGRRSRHERLVRPPARAVTAQTTHSAHAPAGAGMRAHAEMHRRAGQNTRGRASLRAHAAVSARSDHRIRAPLPLPLGSCCGTISHATRNPARPRVPRSSTALADLGVAGCSRCGSVRRCCSATGR